MTKTVISRWVTDKRCAGCRNVDGDYCSVYTNPSAIWRAHMSRCPQATHYDTGKQSVRPEKEKRKKVGR